MLMVGRLCLDILLSDIQIISKLTLIKAQSIKCLVHISFALKNIAGGRVEGKKFGFYEKKHILPVGYLTCFAKYLNICSSNYQYIIRIKKKFVYVPLFLCIFICVICIYYLCLYLSVFIYL